jgi:hypothetical protein
MKAYLRNYRLEFRFYSESRDGRISSIIEFPGALTHGIIYSMPKDEMDELDIIESVPEGLYARETFLFWVKMGNGIRPISIELPIPRGHSLRLKVTWN